MKKLKLSHSFILLLLSIILVRCNKNESLPNQVLSSSEDDALTTTFDTSSLSRGLIAYYPLKGEILDHSGNGHNGTAVGSISYGLNHKGRKNSALVLGSGRVVTDGFFNYQRKDSFSVAMWFTLTTASSGGRLLSTECPEGNFRIGAYNNGIYAIQFGSSAYYLYDTVPLNTWVYIVYTYKKGKVKLFKNGVLKYSGTNADTEPLNYCAPFTIGAKASPSYDTWQGSIENLRVYHRALTGAEVRYLFNH